MTPQEMAKGLLVLWRLAGGSDPRLCSEFSYDGRTFRGWNSREPEKKDEYTHYVYSQTIRKKLQSVHGRISRQKARKVVKAFLKEIYVGTD